MKATANKLDGSRVRLEVEVGADDLKTEYTRAVRRVSGRVSIPGFRRGKAPRHIVESFVGSQSVLREMVEHLVPRVYEDAVEQTGVRPIDQPNLDLPELPSLDAPLVFSAEVAVSPDVDLGDLDAITVESESAEVSDEDVESQIQELRELRKTWEPVGRPAQLEDLAQIEISIDADGLPDSPPQVYSVQLGQNGFPDGFDDSLVGKSADDAFTFSADIPLDDPNPAIRGRKASFTGTLQSVSEARLPELDDAFVMTMAGVETVDALRTDISERLLEQRQHAAQHKLENDVLDALVESSTFEVPDVLVEHEHASLVERETQAMVSRGVAVDTYLGSIGQTREEWEQQLREQALSRVRRGVVLETYADTAAVTAEDGEISVEVDLVAEQYPEARRDTVRRALQRVEGRSRVESTIRNRKALAKLVEAVTGLAGPVHGHHEDHEPDSDVAEVADAAASSVESAEHPESGPAAI